MTKEMWQLARMHELKDFGERLSHYENDEMLIRWMRDSVI